MGEIELIVAAGPVRAIPIPVTAADIVAINGPCQLCGWSLREASGEANFNTSGSVTSPAALGTICGTAVLAAGTYQVDWSVQLAGTVAVGDANNFQLVFGPTGVVISENQGAVGDYPQQQVEFTLATAGIIKIIALAIGTVGAIYTAQMTGIPTTIADAVVEIQDGNNPLGEVSESGNGVDTRWFGGDGMWVRNRINVHVIQGTVTGALYARYQKNTG